MLGFIQGPRSFAKGETTINLDILPISVWQIIQDPDDGLTVLLSGPCGEITSEILKAKLTHELAVEGVRAPHIRIQPVEAIPKSSSGKSPQIKAHPLASAAVSDRQLLENPGGWEAMLYQTAFTVHAEPKDVFASIHEYKLRQRPSEFFSFLGLEKLVKMEFHVLTPNALGPGATYDWTFRILGIPILVFQERIIDWVDGRTTSYRAISGWDMYFRVDIQAEDGGARVIEQIDISTGIPFTDRLFRGFIEWGLKRVGENLVKNGLKAIKQPLLPEPAHQVLDYRQV